MYSICVYSATIQRDPRFVYCFKQLKQRESAAEVCSLW